MLTSLVASREVLEREVRLDPSRYSEKGDRLVRHLRAAGVELIALGAMAGVTSVFIPPRFSRPYIDDPAHGTPFLGSSSMLAARLPRGQVLSKSLKILPKLLVEPGTILLSCSGTIGVSVLCGQSYAGFAVSQHAARIRGDRSISGFIHAYLQTSFGRELVLQQNYGKVIKELTEGQIKSVLVPVLPGPITDRINRRALRATRRYDLARFRWAAAERGMAEAFARLGLPIDPKVIDFQAKEHTFPVASKDLASRLDPHFHEPRLERLRKASLIVPHRLLGDLATAWMPTRFARPSAQAGSGVPLYSSADMMRARKLPGSTVSRTAGKQLDKCRVETNTILICRSGTFGGIVGRVAYVTAPQDGWHISEHMVRVKVSSEFPAEYVFAVLAMRDYGYPLITGLRHGKDIPEIDPEDLYGLAIPELSSEDMRLVVRNVRLANAHFDAANALEAENEIAFADALAIPEEWR